MNLGRLLENIQQQQHQKSKKKKKEKRKPTKTKTKLGIKKIHFLMKKVKITRQVKWFYTYRQQEYNLKIHKEINDKTSIYSR